MPSTSTPEAMRKQWHKITALIGETTALASDDGALAASAPDVSAWSVGQHAEHAARTIKSMAMLVEMGMMPPNPALKPAGFTGKLVLAIGWIPRGKGKAPAPTIPKLTAPAEIRAEIASAQNALNALEKKLDKIAAATGLAGHPVLGGFTSSQWMRFMEIHTHHHLKIIADIRKRAK